MKCKIDPKYECMEIFKTGKGKWDYIGGQCEKCPIFKWSHQLTLFQADPNKIFKCPRCRTQNVWYLHETSVFRCKYCGHLFQESQAITQ